MSDLLGTHDLDSCIFTVGGRRIQGFGESDAVTIAFDEQSFTKKYHADGPITRNRTNARGGTFTVTVAQTNTAVHRYFEEIANRPNPLDVVPIGFTALNSGESWIAGQCWLQKPADASFNKEDSDRVYVFDTGTIRKVS